MKLKLPPTVAVVLIGAVSIAILGAGAASAIEVSVIGANSISVAQGEAFSINIALTNDSANSTFGVDVGVFGFAAAGATVLSGQSAASHLVAGCSVSTCFGGLTSVDNAHYDPNDLTSQVLYSPGDDSIRVIFAVTLIPTTSVGAFDPGLDGGSDDPSSRDATISLIADVVGVHTFTIGGRFLTWNGLAGSNVVLPITNSATFTVTVVEGSGASPVPEPSAALVFALGIAASAARMRSNGSR